MSEEQNLKKLEATLAKDFATWREVKLRHPLFRRRTLRVDLLGVPREPELSDIALGFEVKSDAHTTGVPLGKALKQASDYVLAEVVPDRPDLKTHKGKRVMAVFLWPTPQWLYMIREPATAYQGFDMGMMHLAGSFRVGVARIDDNYREKPLILALGQNPVWVSSRGWRANARNQLVGKRQVGSQRFPILDEIENIRE